MAGCFVCYRGLCRIQPNRVHSKSMKQITFVYVERDVKTCPKSYTNCGFDLILIQIGLYVEFNEVHTIFYML